jgi:hypothetical protein
MTVTQSGWLSDLRLISVRRRLYVAPDFRRVQRVFRERQQHARRRR